MRLVPARAQVVLASEPRPWLDLIDRRQNGPNKSAVNRARFLRRYKQQIRRAVQDLAAERSIKDMEQGGSVTVPRRDTAEPLFRHGPGGDREIVHPGNREFVRGDRVPRPDGAGQGGTGPGHGQSEDDFVFALSREEFLQIFFDDLELPRLERNYLLGLEEQKPVRAGYTTTGSPSNIAVLKTMSNALARRIALAGPIRRETRRGQPGPGTGAHRSGSRPRRAVRPGPHRRPASTPATGALTWRTSTCATATGSSSRSPRPGP